MDKLLRLIDRIYAIALDDDAFAQALQSLSHFVSARGAFHVVADAKTGAVVAAEGVNVDPDVQRLYIEHFAARDIRIPPALDLPVGTLITEHSVLDRSEFQSSEIYNELLAPFDVPHIVAAWTHKSPETVGAISLQRGHAQGAFLKQDEERYRLVMPHLIRALRVRQLLEDLRQRTAGYLEVVNRLPFGVVFLDPAGCVLEASTVAQAHLRAGAAIRFKNGRVRATLADDDRRLQRAIQKTLMSKAEGVIPGDTLTLRRQGGRQLTVAIVPVTSSSLFVSQPPACMLLIFDPHNSPRPATKIVEEALGLTGAEALLACTLFSGITLREAAGQLQLSINTCKAQLKSIYSKTGCRSHVDLAKAILMSGSALTGSN